MLARLNIKLCALPAILHCSIVPSHSRRRTARGVNMPSSPPFSSPLAWPCLMAFSAAGSFPRSCLRNDYSRPLRPPVAFFATIITGGGLCMRYHCRNGGLILSSYPFFFPKYFCTIFAPVLFAQFFLFVVFRCIFVIVYRQVTTAALGFHLRRKALSLVRGDVWKPRRDNRSCNTDGFQRLYWKIEMSVPFVSLCRSLSLLVSVSFRVAVSDLEKMAYSE